MIKTWRDNNYIGILLCNYATHVLDLYVSEDSDQETLLKIICERIGDEKAIEVIKDLKEQRDLISFGISIDSTNPTSNKIKEIDHIISELSKRFVS